MSPATASMVLVEFQARSSDEDGRLNEKEQTILKNIADALPVPVIAEKLGLSVAAVHSIIKNVYEKLWKVGSSASGCI